MTRIAAVQPHHDLLSRLEATSHSRLTTTQLEIDALGEQIAHEASDLGNLACMTGSGLVFRGVGLGLQSLGVARSVAKGAALFSEAVAFRASSNEVTRLRGDTPLEDVFDRRGLFTTLLTFGSLKGVGAALEGQNAVVTNALQASTMVATQNIAYGLGWANEPQGNLTSQFVHALGTNAALSAGQSLLHFMSGGAIAHAERRMELAEQARNYRPTSLSRETAPLRSPFEVMGSSVDPLREIPMDWPQGIAPEWLDLDGSKLWTDGPATNNRELVQGITKSVLKLFGERNVRAQFGYGSGFDGFKPEASSRGRDFDNKFDLVVVISEWESALTELQSRWQFEPEKIAELRKIVNEVGIYCPNPDTLASEFGLVGFKLAVVAEKDFYEVDAQGNPALTFTQFRLKDAIITDAANPSNRLLWVNDPNQVPRLQAHLDAIRDRMLDIAFYLRGSLNPKLFHPLRLLRSSVSVGELTEWMYELSFNIEMRRIYDWGKGKTLYEKRKAEIAPHFMLEAARRFAGRHVADQKLTYQGKEIRVEEITLENLYEVRLVDRNRAVTRERWDTRAREYVDVLFALDKRSWACSQAAIRMGRLSLWKSYEYIDALIYGGRKVRNWLQKGKLSYPFRWLLVKAITSVPKYRVDSISYDPIVFSRIAIQRNALYREGKISDAEWEVLNRAWMADPTMTRQQNVEILRTFDRNIPADSQSQQAYAKFLDSILQSKHMDPKVIQWVKERRRQIS